MRISTENIFDKVYIGWMTNSAIVDICDRLDAKLLAAEAGLQADVPENDLSRIAI